MTLSTSARSGRAWPAWWPVLALFLLWLFLLSPVLVQPFMNGPHVHFDLLFLFNLVTSLLWVGLLHAAARRPFIMHVWLAPLYVTTAIDLFLMAMFRARLSSGYVTIALTDYGDFYEFLLAYWRPVALAALVLLLVYLPGLYAIRPITRSRTPRLAAVFAVLLLATYGVSVARGVYKGTDTKSSFMDLVGHERSAPMGALFQGALAMKMNVETRQLRDERGRDSFGASRVPGAGHGQVYVWVVGESSRPQNWSLFGYSRDTTPRLRATKGVIPLRDVLTTAPHTAVAVPSMLSLEPVTKWSSVIAEKSIVSAFRECNFKTYWLSTQDADSWAGIIPQMAAEAQQRRYYDNAFDGAMLEEFRNILAQAPPAANLFIVLHTKGSHFDYSRRVPDEFRRFHSGKTSFRDQLVDAYDDSILYTDWVLGEIIGELSKRNAASALIYASDHGENLLDDNKELFGHAIGNRYDLQTASFLWLSDAMRREHAQQVSLAEQHAAAPISLSNLPHSVLDLAGIKTKRLDPRMSLFNSAFVVQPRFYLVRGQLHREAASLAP